MVQTVKRILNKHKDPYKALMDYRNIGTKTGISADVSRTSPKTANLLRPKNNDIHVKIKIQTVEVQIIP